MSKYDKTFLKTAYLWAEESFCDRRKVGAIIAKDSRPISCGYNGTVSGSDNCCEEEYDSESLIEEATIELDIEDNIEEEVNKFIKINGLIFEKYIENNNIITIQYRRPKKRTKDSVVHAEANAITFAAKEGLSLSGSTLYVTLSPCMNCANLIIQSGIKRVVFSEEYRVNKSLSYLKENGVIVEHIEI